MAGVRTPRPTGGRRHARKIFGCVKHLQIWSQFFVFVHDRRRSATNTRPPEHRFGQALRIFLYFLLLCCLPFAGCTGTSKKSSNVQKDLRLRAQNKRVVLWQDSYKFYNAYNFYTSTTDVRVSYVNNCIALSVLFVHYATGPPTSTMNAATTATCPVRDRQISVYVKHFHIFRFLLKTAAPPVSANDRHTPVFRSPILGSSALLQIVARDPSRLNIQVFNFSSEYYKCIIIIKVLVGVAQHCCADHCYTFQ